MSYRPICDFWWLARAKLKGGVKYYGAYLGGFPERARALLACRIDQPVLHVCGGMAKLYPYQRAFGPYDKTLDLDPACSPDFLQDARDSFPPVSEGRPRELWSGVLIDPPYSEEDSRHYAPGPLMYPSPSLLLKNAFAVLPKNGRVGIIHYICPQPPKNSIFVASIGIECGFNNRVRLYSVFEKL